LVKGHLVEVSSLLRRQHEKARSGILWSYEIHLYFMLFMKLVVGENQMVCNQKRALNLGKLRNWIKAGIPPR
jgi:hypothetical protein